MPVPTSIFKKHPKILFISIAVDLFILDQASKFWAQFYLDQPVVLWPEFFELVYAENTGIAWSIPVPQLVLVLGIPALLVVGAFVVPRYFDFNKPLTNWIFASILAGALGNYLDRLRLGFVVDFISVGSWPIFNLADAYISLAAFLLVLFYANMERIPKSADGSNQPNRTT